MNNKGYGDSVIFLVLQGAWLAIGCLSNALLGCLEIWSSSKQFVRHKENREDLYPHKRQKRAINLLNTNSLLLRSAYVEKISPLNSVAQSPV